ncbi:MAG TPA: hypothetical protein VLE20_10675 [Blastocatellia bacterium]|nr:hypothetical protein [Blastocatellia bacterium]
MKKKDKREASIQSSETEPLADLELTGEQAEQTKAGAETRAAVADPVFVIIGSPRVGE